MEEEELIFCEHLAAFMNSNTEIRPNSDLNGNEMNLIKEDSLENIREASAALKTTSEENGKSGESKEISSQDSLKPSDSLELVTDSLNNNSLSSGDIKNQESDFDDSLATPMREKENGTGLTSSGSSQMVRSGTFDLLSSIPPDETNFNRPIEQKRASDPSQRPQIDSLDLNEPGSPAKKKGGKSTREECDDSCLKNDDTQTPVADASLSSSLFQFFIDIEQNEAPRVQEPHNEKSNEAAKSGLIFIDFNSVNTEKSRTLERDKKRGDGSATGSRTDRSSPMNIKTSESHSSDISKHHEQSSTLEKRKSHLKDSSNRLFTSRKKVPDSSVPIERYKMHKPYKSSTPTFRNEHSPLSSMDSGMLSSLNSDGAGVDDDDWLTRAEPKRRSNLAPGRSNDPIQPLIGETSYNTDTDPDGSKNDSFILNRTAMSCSKLGEDLLQMFIKEINSDITIRTDGAPIRAHKCILISRSPYFAAMFRGEWTDSRSSSISLKGILLVIVCGNI